MPPTLLKVRAADRLGAVFQQFPANENMHAAQSGFRQISIRGPEDLAEPVRLCRGKCENRAKAATTTAV